MRASWLLLLLPLLLLLLLPLSTSAVPELFLPGPHEVDNVHINREIFGSLDHSLDIFAPHSPGSFPVLVFFSGLAGAMPGWIYSILFHHLASWGYVVICPSALFSNPVESYKAEWVQPVLDWASAHLSPGSLHPPLHPELLLDMERLVLAGHSSGAHVAVEFLKKYDCSPVQALLLLSPVDGVDPFGLIPDFCISPGQLLNFNIPTLILAAGLDPLPGIGAEGGLVPACAPAELGSDRFYAALPGPTVLVNATAYGHGDILDQLEVDIIDIIKFCKSDPEMEKPPYRQEVGGQLLTFLSYLSGSCSSWPLLSGQQASGTGVSLEVQWKGQAEEVCGRAGCHRAV